MLDFANCSRMENMVIKASECPFDGGGYPFFSGWLEGQSVWFENIAEEDSADWQYGWDKKYINGEASKVDFHWKGDVFTE